VSNVFRGVAAYYNITFFLAAMKRANEHDEENPNCGIQSTGQ